MTIVALAVIAFGALLGGLASGAAGFAGAVVFSSIWAYVLPPSTILLLGAALAGSLHITSVWKLRHAIDWRRLAPFAIGSLVGVPIGTALLTRLEPALFRTLLGIVLLAFVALQARPQTRRPLRLSARAGQLLDGVIGVVSGFVGGVTLIHGPLVVVWCALRGWDKRAARLVYQPNVLFTNFVVLISTGLHAPPADFSQLLVPALAAFPAAFVGLAFGLRLFEICSEAVFRYALLALIFVSGLTLVLR